MDSTGEGCYRHGSTDNQCTTGEICRKYNVSATQMYKWKENFVQSGTNSLAGKDASAREARLELENRWLKEMVADLSLANELLKNGGQEQEELGI
jgi:transposase-like protein